MPEAFLELDLTIKLRGVLTQLHLSPDSGPHLRAASSAGDCATPPAQKWGLLFRISLSGLGSRYLRDDIREVKACPRDLHRAIWCPALSLLLPLLSVFLLAKPAWQQGDFFAQCQRQRAVLLCQLQSPLLLLHLQPWRERCW